VIEPLAIEADADAIAEAEVVREPTGASVRGEMVESRRARALASHDRRQVDGSEVDTPLAIGAHLVCTGDRNAVDARQQHAGMLTRGIEPGYATRSGTEDRTVLVEQHATDPLPIGQPAAGLMALDQALYTALDHIGEPDRVAVDSEPFEIEPRCHRCELQLHLRPIGISPGQ
jgi:hypothetical protein